jgi:lysophospholipase L1-like esterase
MLLAPNTRFVMIGDSITDSGRTRPSGEGLFDPYGTGYVNIVRSLIEAAYPDGHIRITNVGESGNTVRNLKERWERDVLDLRPDWLSVMIGINDVWRQFDLPHHREKHVLPDEYRTTLDTLLGRTRPSLKGLILATPYFIEPNRDDPMRRRMDEYGAIVAGMAEKHDAILVDTQAAFDTVLEHVHPMTLAWDRVHPTSTGHMVIARAFFKALRIDL